MVRATCVDSVVEEVAGTDRGVALCDKTLTLIDNCLQFDAWRLTIIFDCP